MTNFDKNKQMKRVVTQTETVLRITNEKHKLMKGIKKKFHIKNKQIY